MTNRFVVHEHFNGFELEDVRSGRRHWLSDGVDCVFNSKGKALPPGGEKFCKLWAEQFNADESSTMEAYFPELKPHIRINLNLDGTFSCYNFNHTTEEYDFSEQVPVEEAMRMVVKGCTIELLAINPDDHDKTYSNYRQIILTES